MCSMTTQVPGQEERLARLAARRGGAFAPPTPSTSARATTASAPPPPPAPGRSSISPAAAPANRTARRHAAKGSRRAALALSVTTTVGLTAYFAQVDSSAASSSAAVSTATAVARATTSTSATTASTSGATTATQATTAAQASTASTTATAAAEATLADGSYTGTTDTNRWGPVQVQVTITGGKITDVTALQTPTGGKSDRINAQAVPILQSEALTAQSAQIDTVSGATYTSTSYKISLQSALDQAAAATSQAKVAA